MRKGADKATKTAVWEVYKFIHVNTVAPFGTFRTKIRKWKKQHYVNYEETESYQVPVNQIFVKDQEWQARYQEYQAFLERFHGKKQS